MSDISESGGGGVSSGNSSIVKTGKIKASSDETNMDFTEIIEKIKFEVGPEESEEKMKKLPASSNKSKKTQLICISPSSNALYTAEVDLVQLKTKCNW